MNIFKWLGALLFGPNDGPARGAVESVANVVDKATYTEQEKSQDDASDVASARQFAPAPSHQTWLDVIVDGWHRLIRPAFATWAFFIVAGWVNAPRYLENMPAVAGSLVVTIVTFYFGGRAVLKDLPAAIALLRGKR